MKQSKAHEEEKEEEEETVRETLKIGKNFRFQIDAIKKKKLI